MFFNRSEHWNWYKVGFWFTDDIPTCARQRFIDEAEPNFYTSTEIAEHASETRSSAVVSVKDLAWHGTTRSYLMPALLNQGDLRALFAEAISNATVSAAKAASDAEGLEGCFPSGAGLLIAIWPDLENWKLPHEQRKLCARPEAIAVFNGNSGIEVKRLELFDLRLFSFDELADEDELELVVSALDDCVSFFLDIGYAPSWQSVVQSRHLSEATRRSRSSCKVRSRL